MDAVAVTLTCWSREPHLSQIYTGLTMLHRRGLIRLQQKIVRLSTSALNAKQWHCRIEAAGRHYYVDTHDSPELDQEGLRDCDVYLKRILTGTHPKVRPLGLNYAVRADGFDGFEAQRRMKIRGVASQAEDLRQGPLPASALEGVPLEGEIISPRVLFVCRTSEPNEQDPIQDQDRIAIDEMHADIIFALRKAFGRRCIAGFDPTPHAIRTYREALLEVDLSDQRRYLEAVQAASICVTTAGPNGSDSWQLGQYVAAHRAIVSAPLPYDAPNFHSGIHYLPFSTPQACVEQAGILMESSWASQQISTANAVYYHQHLRPDMLVADAIELSTHSGSVAKVADRNRVIPPEARELPLGAGGHAA